MAAVMAVPPPPVLGASSGSPPAGAQDNSFQYFTEVYKVRTVVGRPGGGPAGRPAPARPPLPRTPWAPAFGAAPGEAAAAAPPRPGAASVHPQTAAHSHRVRLARRRACRRAVGARSWRAQGAHLMVTNAPRAMLSRAPSDRPTSTAPLAPQVELCGLRVPHDWALCARAHRGERAARRDPRVYSYSSIPCAAAKEVRAWRARASGCACDRPQQCDRPQKADPCAQKQPRPSSRRPSCASMRVLATPGGRGATARSCRRARRALLNPWWGWPGSPAASSHRPPRSWRAPPATCAATAIHCEP